MLRSSFFCSTSIVEMTSLHCGCRRSNVCVLEARGSVAQKVINKVWLMQHSCDQPSVALECDCRLQLAVRTSPPVCASSVQRRSCMFT